MNRFEIAVLGVKNKFPNKTIQYDKCLVCKQNKIILILLVSKDGILEWDKSVNSVSGDYKTHICIDCGTAQKLFYFHTKNQCKFYNKPLSEQLI
jgi:hypothetical protein